MRDFIHHTYTFQMYIKMPLSASSSLLAFPSSNSLLSEPSLRIPNFFVFTHTFRSDLVTAIPVEGNHRNEDPPDCIPSCSEHHPIATSHLSSLEFYACKTLDRTPFIPFPLAMLQLLHWVRHPCFCTFAPSSMKDKALSWSQQKWSYFVCWLLTISQT